MKLNWLQMVGMMVTIIVLNGCSHKISLAPSLSELEDVKVENKINANVGYYVSNSMKNIEVITPGGGGDKVKYTPYKDTEAALNTMLSKKFKRVYSLKSLEDKNYINEKNIMYVFTTNIYTDSSSTNFFIWPPTDFTIELTCDAVDTNSNKIWTEKVSANGYANAGELMNDFSLSAKRATKDAFSKMLEKLEETNVFNQGGNLK